MIGLLKWHVLNGDAEALTAARRIADLLCATFLGTGRRIHEVGELEMNMAPYHSLLLLHEKTGDMRYLELADEIEEDFEKPPAGDYVRTALQGLEFFQTPKPRWESLHVIQGIAGKYFITKKKKYRKAFEHLWWSMLKGDRHNNGGFTSGEKATGSPYHLGPIETCCTVAWTAMSVDMLRLTGDSIVADELELTLFNSGLGLMSPSGRWVTYDTPMEGRRENSVHSIVFQARPGTSELNCCSVNGPRVLGMLSDWALMSRNGAFTLNYYGPGILSFKLPSGQQCRLIQITDYPRLPRVEVKVELEGPEEFTLGLRIPHWSKNTVVHIAGQRMERVVSGEYLEIERRWRSGDQISIEFDFSPHFWAREEPGHFYTDWETEWKVFGPVSTPSRDDRLAVLAKYAALPATLDVDGHMISRSNVTSRRGELDFKSLPRPHVPVDTFYAFTVLESPSEVVVPIRFSAAWWSVITVNGKKVYDDDSCGFDGDVSLRLCRLDLPLRKGSNLIGWAVSRHPNHPTWGLTAGISTPLSRLASSSGEDAFSLASIYRGPLLLAFDHRFNTMDIENIPGFDVRRLQEHVAQSDTAPQPWLLLECAGTDGQPVRLCDFASAGATGNPYRTWFNVQGGVRPAEFTHSNPLRSMRPGEEAL